MSLTVPREVEHLAERRAAELGLPSAAAYVARLVAKDAAAAADPDLEAALRAGLEDADEPWDPDALRAEGRAALTAARERG